MAALPETIETRRLLLRQPTERDIPEIVRELGRWEVARWLGRVPHPYVPRHARTWLADQRRQRDAGRDLTFAITLRARPDRLIGTVGWRGIDGENPTLGYWLESRRWGSGYTSEAVAAVLASLREIRPDSAPVSAAMVDNQRSIGVLLKAGFRREFRREIHWNAAQRRKVAVACFLHPGRARNRR